MASTVIEEAEGLNPRTLEELTAMIAALVDIRDGGESGYEQSASALWKAGLAATNFVAHVAGVTGFQYAWATMQYLRAARRLQGPFAILDGENLLYPQSADLVGKVADYVVEWLPQMAPIAREHVDKYDRELTTYMQELKSWLVRHPEYADNPDRWHDEEYHRFKAWCDASPGGSPDEFVYREDPAPYRPSVAGRVLEHWDWLSLQDTPDAIAARQAERAHFFTFPPVTR